MGRAVATLAGGCFWCIETVFNRLAGVESAVSGYMGGHTAKPAYRDICNGDTGHAEVVQITFDPDVIAFRHLLEVFFTIHDPTQRNRQGHDVGTQYRSAIFPVDGRQHAAAAAYIAELDAARVFAGPIATTLEPLGAFYPAEAYHHRYAERNPAQPYVAAVALPKLDKLHAHFGTWTRRSPD